MAETIFSKILDGEIPCHRVYEDEHVLAFLDVAPLSVGHTIVIPKERVARFHELSDDAAAALGRALPRICRAILEVTGASAYNLLQNNGLDAYQEIDHVHVHVIPRRGDTGLELRWAARELGDDGPALAERMRAAIGSG
ncbi:MAG: HIT family protein [Planctomycetota bacterium]|jgi:histidine triad (HIT) family protein